MNFMRVVFSGLVVLLTPAITLAGDNPVLGTWKLKSFVREVTATGEKIQQNGEHPNGYLSYSADGRMYAIVIADNRIRPRDANPTDAERVKLHQTMTAYAGTYTLEENKVTPSCRCVMERGLDGHRPSPILQSRRKLSHNHDSSEQESDGWSRGSLNPNLGKGESTDPVSANRRERMLIGVGVSS